MLCRPKSAGVVLVVASLLLGLSALAVPSVGARQSTSDDKATGQSGGYADTELIEVLEAAGLMQEWLDATSMSPEAALTTVVDSTFAATRAEFVAEMELFVERRDKVADRDDAIDELEADATVLEEVARDLRRNAVAGPGAARGVLSSVEAEHMRSRLATVVTKPRWVGISFDPVVLAEHRLIDARDQLMREITVVHAGPADNAKTSDATVTRLTELHGDLQRVKALLGGAHQAAMPSRFQLLAARSDLVERMPELHTRRTLLASAVDGLPLVTFDAYVRAAAVLDDSCPVEWNLLAGIGSVESFHGTIGGSTVQASGAVSVAILGPLLDGGATAREAAEAAAAAEAEAEAEAVAAEEAELAEAEEAAAAFNEMVWGPRAEVEAADTDPEPLGEPLHDPALWGNDVPRSEPVEDADEASDEDEEPELRGNGFAVIHDTDGGRLDGNSRWDRAVGPMQFIPETWSYYATDGNGDGVEDPQNLYDAAASAGKFLCSLSNRRGPSPYDFVLGYNASDTYVRNVMNAANAFGSSPLPESPTAD